MSKLKYFFLLIFIQQYYFNDIFVSCQNEEVQTYTSYMGKIETHSPNNYKTPSGKVFGISPRQLLIKDFKYNDRDKIGEFYATFIGGPDHYNLRYDGDSWDKGSAEGFKKVDPAKDVNIWFDFDVDVNTLESISVGEHHFNNSLYYYGRVIKPDNFQFPPNKDSALKEIYSNYFGNIKPSESRKSNPRGKVFGLTNNHFLVKDFVFTHDDPASFYVKFINGQITEKLKVGSSYDNGTENVPGNSFPPKDIHLWAKSDLNLTEIESIVLVNRRDLLGEVIKPGNFRFNNNTNPTTPAPSTTTPSPSTTTPSSSTTASTPSSTVPPTGNNSSIKPLPNREPGNTPTGGNTPTSGKNNLTGLNIKDIQIIFLPKEGSNDIPTTVHVQPGQGTSSVVSNDKLPANVIVNIDHKSTPISLRNQRDVNVTVIVKPNPNESSVKKPLQNVNVDLVIDSTAIIDPIDKQHVNVTAHVNLPQQQANGPTFDTDANLWIKLRNVPPPTTTTTTTTTAAPIIRPNPDVNVTYSIDPTHGTKPMNTRAKRQLWRNTGNGQVNASVQGPAEAGLSGGTTVVKPSEPVVGGGQINGNVNATVQGPADAGGTVTLRPQGQGSLVDGLEPVVQLKLCIHPAKATESALAHVESDHHVTIKSFNSDCSCSKPKNKLILIRGTAADVSAAKGLLTEWGAV